MPQVTVDMPKFVKDSLVADDAAIQAHKLIHKQSIDKELFIPATTIAAYTSILHIVRGGEGTLLGFEAAICGTVPTGDHTVTVDLKKSTGAGAFATVLSSTIGFDSSSVLRTAVAAVINPVSLSLVDGDILEVVVTVAGSTSSQGAGLSVTLTYEETWD